MAAGGEVMITPDERSAIETRHRSATGGTVGDCAVCFVPLPCDVVRLLEENARLRNQMTASHPSRPPGRRKKPSRGSRRNETFTHALWCSVHTGGECECGVRKA